MFYLKVLLIAKLYTFALTHCLIFFSITDFVSSDCGSSDTYTDDNSITWSGDDDYLRNGEPHVVQTDSISPVMDTLRAFTTPNKNCYTMEATKGAQDIVWANFYYGNYDNKPSPPTSSLQFDGNHWTRVETTSTGYVYDDVIYNVKGDSLSVCVAQTRQDQFPIFIGP